MVCTTAQKAVALEQVLQQRTFAITRGQHEVDELATATERKLRLVDQGEVLADHRAMAQRRVTRDTEYPQRKTTDVGHTVRRTVHAAVGQACPNLMRARFGKQALAGKLRQIGQDLQRAAGSSDLLAVQSPSVAIPLRFARLQCHKLFAVAGEAFSLIGGNFFLPLGAGLHGHGAGAFGVRRMKTRGSHGRGKKLGKVKFVP